MRAPGQAQVGWNHDDLLIRANDSSLNDILRQVAAETGAQLDGLGQDQRVFGVYGPRSPQRGIVEAPGRGWLQPAADGRP